VRFNSLNALVQGNIPHAKLFMAYRVQCYLSGCLWNFPISVTDSVTNRIAYNSISSIAFNIAQSST
jgi:hypothetical protein